MKKLVCYYAHPMMTYNSTIEKEDIELLERLGFEVLNPNQKVHQEGCENFIRVVGKDKVMSYFTGLINDFCDIIAFRAIPSGELLSGVAEEVRYAAEISLPIIELPRQLKSRSLDYEKTKQYLIESGYYKD